MWWESMTLLQQILFVLASSATAIMIIFLIMMLLGFETDEFDGGDVPDLTGDSINDDPLTGIAGLKVLTLRGILVLVSIGGWTAYLLVETLLPWLAILIGVIVGVVAAYLQALAFRATLRLESEGNLDYKNAIGLHGTVYMRVPKSKTGKGKVTVNIQDRLIEIDAITEEESDILPKTSVIVSGLEDPTTIIVKTK